MATIYTFNNKVLKNSANDKWLIKAVPQPPSFDEITIGTQTWMAKNLDIDDGGSGILSFEDSTYGTQYFYNYEGITRVLNGINGWHLPSSEEWQTLISYIGGDYQAKKLISVLDNGTDDYGFNGRPFGWVYDGVNISDKGSLAAWRCSTPSYMSSQSQYYINCNQNPYWYINNDYISNDTTYYLSVRLIKDS
jgi:uncharacterized protein (TIGR02145 family)